MLKTKIRQIRNHELSAEDSIRNFISLIHAKPEINAFLSINENALKEAKLIDKKIKSNKAGLLAGLAIGVKSNISVMNQPLNCASRTLDNYSATFDADVIKKIKKEDGIILGMLNMDEFACGNSGETSAFGATDNPRCPGTIPGGSSSASAAAVAAGLCDLSLGSDTGGSIRNPASHCGVVGIKPSYGRVSRFGLVDLSMSLDQIGPFANSVFGCSLLMQVISGVSKFDPTTIDMPVPNYSHKLKVQGLRIGLSDDLKSLCVDKKIYEMIETLSLQFSSSSKSKIVNVALKNVHLAVSAYYPLVYVEFYSGTRKFDGRKYGKKIEDYCGEEVMRRILGGEEISRSEFHGMYYRKALVIKKRIEQDFINAFKEVDIIISPVTPTLPHKIGTRINDPKLAYAEDAFTIPANLGGICAGVVPAGRIDKIPIGLQVMAPAFKEDLLLNVLTEIEVMINDVTK